VAVVTAVVAEAAPTVAEAEEASTVAAAAVGNLGRTGSMSLLREMERTICRERR